MKDEWLQEALKRHYRKLIGELLRLERPPKYETRLLPDRIRYQAEEAERLRRRDEIHEGLPHLAHVVRMFDPQWQEADAKPIRPRAPRTGLLASNTFAGAAMDILRDAEDGYTIGELVKEIAGRYDIDVGTSDAYQKVHTAVNNGLKTTYRNYVVSLGGRPERFAHADRQRPSGEGDS